jgi:hypothetical protein
MITNIGKNIISKYLVGQTTSYASYIAIGCGTKPISSLNFNITDILATPTKLYLTCPDHEFEIGDSVYVKLNISSIDGTKNIVGINENILEFEYSGNAISQQEITGTIYFDFSNKENLDFEMIRVPVTSKGYVNQDGVSKIVLTAEVPTEERYEISEIGVWSAKANPNAGVYDSKTIFSFDTNKNWTVGPDQTAISEVLTPLDAGNDGLNDEKSNNITVTHKIFSTNADNRVLASNARTIRNERPRFLNKALAFAGDSCEIIEEGGQQVPVTAPGNHLVLTGENVNLKQNTPTDELRLAFSVINKFDSNSYVPDAVKIIIEFSNSTVFGSGEWARFVVDESLDFSNNRYFVIKKQLQDLVKSSNGFNWSSVDTIKVYCSVIENDIPSNQYFVLLDGLRLENTSIINPLYGLVGYTRLTTDNKRTIVKSENKASYLEFRFGVDV